MSGRRRPSAEATGAWRSSASAARVLAAIAGLVLVGCSSSPPSYRDGTFTGRSSPDEDGAYSEIVVTIEGNDIVAAELRAWDGDGNLKGEDYGLLGGGIVNEDYYEAAQDAVAAFERYAEHLVEVDDPDEVDVITGASLTYEQFQEAARDALDQARE